MSVLWQSALKAKIRKAQLSACFRILFYKGGISLSDDNIKKNLSDGADDEAPVTQTSSDGDWQWDAAVPETDTENISFEDLTVSVGNQENQAEEAEEDNASEASDNDAEEKEEPTEEEEEKAYSDDDGMCVICGKPRKKSPSDLYCDSCREKFLKTNYGIGHIIFAFVMVIVAALGYFVCSATCSLVPYASDAKKSLSQLRYNDAVSACQDMSETAQTVNSGINAVFKSINNNAATVEWFGIGKKATKIMLESFADVVSVRNSVYETFIETVDSNITSSELNKPAYAKVKKVYDFCNELVDIAPDYMGGLSDFISTDSDGTSKIDYSKALAYIDGLEPDTVAKTCMANYCRMYAALYADKKTDVLDFCGKLCTEAEEFDYIFLPTYMDACYDMEDFDRLKDVSAQVIALNVNNSDAYYYNIKACTNLGDFDAALAKCDELKANDPESLDYYGFKAGLLRRQSKFDEGLKLCKEGLAIGEDAEIYRQQAILYMLSDDKDSALESIKQAYEIVMRYDSSSANTYTLLDVLDTAAVITCICGDEDTYKEIVEFYEYQQVEFTEKVTDCIKGEITFEEIFMEGTGEIS